MKKILFIIINLFIILPIVHADTWFGSWEKITEMNVTFKRGDSVYSNSPFLFRMEDDKVVYCVKPFTDIGHDAPYIEYLYNDSKFNISDEHLEKIKLIAYYGYNYPGHEDRIWYGVTQFLIWKTFNLDDIYFTNERYGNKIDAYQDEINEIEYLVNTHNTLPSFYNNKFNYKKNNTYIVEDTNNVLTNYIISDSNIDSYIIGNKLYINTKEDGEYYIKLKRKRELNNNYILYGLDNYQTLFYPGGIDDINLEIKIEVNTGSITINKKDSENINALEATLKGAKYSIIKDDIIIDSISTDENGIAYINDLDLGEYIIKEEIPSKGYLLDNNIYYANITKDNKNIIIKSYEDIIKANITLRKYYKDINEYKIENNSVFELYDSANNKIKEYKIENGEIIDILPYGTYYLKQIKGKEGYNLINRYDFVINEVNDFVFNLYNDPIEVNIKITKYYGEDNNYSLEDNALFELYNSDNELLKEYKLDNGIIEDKLKYGEYYLKQINGIDGYKYIDDYSFKVIDNDLSIDLYNNKIKEPLIVEVPNTGINNKFYFSPLLILFGTILIIISKKTTQ